MTESEATSMLVGIGDAVATYTGLWVSVTFAYLTVAYFVGNSLSRFQCVAVSGLYIVSAFLFGFGGVNHAKAWISLFVETDTVYGNVYLPTVVRSYSAGLAVVFVLGTLVSLYFMYNVRQTKKS